MGPSPIGKLSEEALNKIRSRSALSRPCSAYFFRVATAIRVDMVPPLATVSPTAIRTTRFFFTAVPTRIEAERSQNLSVWA